jgi:hypothetical protein
MTMKPEHITDEDLLVALTEADRRWDAMKRNTYTTHELMQDKEQTRRIDGWCR